MSGSPAVTAFMDPLLAKVKEVPPEIWNAQGSEGRGPQASRVLPQQIAGEAAR